MKRILALVLVVALLPFPAFAQSADTVAAAKAQLQAQHVDLTGPCGALKLTNLVAWNLRPNYGLLHKAGGFRAILKADGSCLSGEQSSDPEGFATDYVIRGRDGFGFDLLGDSGGANNPQWAGPEDGPDMVARNFANYREPFDPIAYMTGSTPVPVPVPTPVPVPVPLPSIDLSGVYVQLQMLELHLANISQRIEVVNEQVQQGRMENRGFFAAVGSEWKKILTYAAPIVGAIFAGTAIGKHQ